MASWRWGAEGLCSTRARQYVGPVEPFTAANERYLVLEDYVTHEDFLRLAGREGWTLARTYPSDGEREPFEEVWVDAGRTHAVHYIDDPVSGTRHLRLRGPELDTLLRRVVGPLPIYPPDELIEDARGPLTEQEAIATLFRLAVTFAVFEPRVQELFRAYLRHPRPLVRKAADQALGYRAWPSSVPLIGEAAARESDPGAKAFAERLFEELQGR